MLHNVSRENIKRAVAIRKRDSESIAEMILSLDAQGREENQSVEWMNVRLVEFGIMIGLSQATIETESTNQTTKFEVVVTRPGAAEELDHSQYVNASAVLSWIGTHLQWMIRNGVDGLTFAVKRVKS